MKYLVEALSDPQIYKDLVIQSASARLSSINMRDNHKNEPVPYRMYLANLASKRLSKSFRYLQKWQRVLELKAGEPLSSRSSLLKGDPLSTAGKTYTHGFSLPSVTEATSAGIVTRRPGNGINGLLSVT